MTMCQYQVYQPLGDSFLTALVSWNPLKHLRCNLLSKISQELSTRRFHLTSGHQLSLLAANILIQAKISLTLSLPCASSPLFFVIFDQAFGDHVIQACPRLEHLGGLASWGRVEKEELEMMQKEVKARNLYLTLQ